MSTTIPVIDVSPLAGGSESGVAKVAAEIGKACRETGFFYIANHTVPAELIQAAFDTSATFFAQDEVVKGQVLYDAANNRGYIPMQGESLDPNMPADLKEAYNIGLELPADAPEPVAGQMFRATNLWPEMAGFRETMLAYFDACHALGRSIHRAFAVDLGLHPTSSRTRSTGRWRTCACCIIRQRPPGSRQVSSAPENIPITAASRCWRPTGLAGCRYARAPATGSTRRMCRAPSSAISATA